jgi:hypothetical protein
MSLYVFSLLLLLLLLLIIIIIIIIIIISIIQWNELFEIYVNVGQGVCYLKSRAVVNIIIIIIIIIITFTHGIYNYTPETNHVYRV